MRAWKTLETKIGYNHPFMRVREDKVKLPNGVIIDDYTVWENRDVAQTVPYRSDGMVALVRQYKHGAGDIILEFPGGLLNTDDSPEDAARRELLEETSLEANKFIPLASVVHHPTKETSSTHLFLALDVTASLINGSPDETEEISVEWYKLSDLPAMIFAGLIRQTGTVAATFLALEKLNGTE